MKGLIDYIKESYVNESEGKTMEFSFNDLEGAKEFLEKVKDFDGVEVDTEDLSLTVNIDNEDVAKSVYAELKKYFKDTEYIFKTVIPRNASVLPPPVGKYNKLAISLSAFFNAGSESSLYSPRITSHIIETMKTIWNNLHPSIGCVFESNLV